MIGTLSQMASARLNNINTHEVKKILTEEKTDFENIIRSTAARIAATTLRVLKGLPQTPGFINILLKFTNLIRVQLRYNILIKNSRKHYLITSQYPNALDTSNRRETERFLGFATDKIALQVSVLTFRCVMSVTSCKLSQQQQLKKRCYLWRKAKLTAAISLCFQETRESVTVLAAKGHICKLVQTLERKY